MHPLRTLPLQIMMLAGSLALFFLLCLPFDTLAAQTTFQAQVVGVSDGDTIKVVKDGHQVRIRLAEIDCPELHGQPFGKAAKRFTLNLVANQVVEVRQVDTDRYGRVVAEILLPDGRSLNRLLVENGLAWWYRAYSRDASLGELEAQAREAKRGLWSEPNPQPPWEFRRAKRHK